MVLNSRWSDYQEMSNIALSWVEDTTEYMNTIGALEGANGFVHLPYAAGFQTPLDSYGAASVDFMQRASAKYDPKQLFQTLLPYCFKLSQISDSGRIRL